MKTVTQKARLRQAIIEYIAEEPWAEELLLQEHHEAPSTEHTVPSNQTHSGQPTQKPVPESSQEPTLPKPIDTSKPNDTVQPFDPSDKHSMSREKNIKTKESVPVETKPGQTIEAPVSSRIKQKERPVAKEKRNTVAGEIKTREPTVRSNEALKVSKERGSQTIEPSVAPSGDVKPTTKGAPLPAVQAKVISATLSISRNISLGKRNETTVDSLLYLFAVIFNVKSSMIQSVLCQCNIFVIL